MKFETCCSLQVHFKVPDDPLTDFDGYMKTVDELQKAIIFFTNKSWLKGSRETLHNAEASLRKAMQKLEKLFKYTLTINRFKSMTFEAN